MLIEARGDYFPEGFAEGKIVEFTHSTEQRWIGTKTGDKPINTLSTSYLGFVKSIIEVASSDTKLHANISHVKRLDIDGTAHETFQNFVIIEGDSNFSIISVMDKEINDQSRARLVILNDSSDTHQI